MNYRHHNSGISLVLVAVLLVVLGGASAMLVVRKDREAVWNPRTESQTDLAKLKEALIAFQQANHRLPCVAPRNVLPGAAGYSEEISNCAGGAAATGGTIRLNLSGGNYLRIGAVPTKTLKLPEVAGEDEWKNRILYAVTESLTDPYQFTNGVGIVRVNDAAGNAILTNAAFVVLSHGADGKGAYGAKGASIGKVCATTVGLDQANCNDNDAVFVSDTIETTAGATFFDDIVMWDKVDSFAQTVNRPCMRTGGSAPLGDVNWSPGCINNNWTNMLNGSTQNLTNTNTPGATGTITITCNNGALVQSAPSCSSSSCPHQTLNNVGSACSNGPAITCGSMSGYNFGAYVSAVERSNDGTDCTWDCCFAQPAVGVCGPPNGISVTNYDGFPSRCSRGFASSITDTGNGYSWICQGGVNASCSATKACPTQTLNWGAGCSASFAQINSGTTSPNTINTAGGYTGSATAVCNGHNWDPPTGSCVAGRTPLCYDYTGDPPPDPCGVYHYSDGSADQDTAPCDSNGVTPPSGWGFCSGGGGSVACGDDSINICTEYIYVGQVYCSPGHCNPSGGTCGACGGCQGACY